MADVHRQPFAPLDGARLQNLTSIKNRQNAISVSSAAKRKASEAVVDVDDFENIDPSIFSKRSKGSDSSDGFSNDYYKPPLGFVLTKASSTPLLPTSSITSPVKYSSTARHRSMLNPKSPAARLNTKVARNSPLSAPAGRSPTRGNKRIGILNRRRTASPWTRIDPPSFNLSPAPFSLDAAIKGTVPSYASRHSTSTSTSLSTSTNATSSSSVSSLHEPEMKQSWFFDIHEDTPEQEMTNLLQHSTCILDISSDEESEHKIRRERAEGRDKENIPPADDISQTSARRSATSGNSNGMDYEKPRHALGDLNVEDFYAAGVDPLDLFIVPADDEDGTVVDGEQNLAPVDCQKTALEVPNAPESSFEPKLEKVDAKETTELEADAEELMKRDGPAQKAAVLEPIEGTGQLFDLWESGSFKDEGDGARSPSPVPASPSSETTEILDFDR